MDYVYDDDNDVYQDLDYNTTDEESVFFNEEKKFNIGLSDKPTSSVEGIVLMEKTANNKHLGVKITPYNHTSNHTPEEIVEITNTVASTNKSLPLPTTTTAPQPI